MSRMHQLHAAEWRYDTEGGQHALFSYIPPQDRPQDPLFQHCLLRIRKSDLARSATPIQPSRDANLTTAEKDLRYVTKLIEPMLRPFVDIPQVLALDWALVHQLREAALQSGRIPTKRRADWNPASASSTLEGAAHCPGLLLPDYRRSLVPSDDDCPVLTIELKPKAGYTAVSPLVDPQRRRKFWTTRYQLLRQTESSDSTYDPLDLFSGELDRIRQAIRSLIDTPHNNLSLYLNGRRYESAALFDQLARSIAWGGMNTRDSLEEILSLILHREPILKNLHQLQILDVVDGDGAILMYHRLLELLHGSKEKAECLIDNVTAGDGLSENSPIAGPMDANVVKEYFQFVEPFAQRLRQFGSLPDDDLDEAYSRANRLVLRMRVDELVYCLQLWLLSLVACDTSVFINLFLIPDDGSPADSIFPVQSEDRGGEFTIVQEPKRFIVKYEIKVVDIGQKPARKLRSRQSKEDRFNVT